VSPQDLPFNILAFLQERIAGTSELAALFLVRSDALRGWSAAAVAEQLELPESWAGPALEGLCDAELLVADETETEQRFWYRPATPALESVVTVLSEIYDDQRSDVLRILSDKAVERIRAAAAKTFSGAFEGRQGKQSDDKAKASKRHDKREGNAPQGEGHEREQGEDGESRGE